uniref:RNA recognition motif containing protein RRM-I.1 n=1 Tax=Apopellia endiviifolia (species B) TaxID=119729 RepID=A0A6B7NSW9_9MARC|nr:RNA recognition motif containing protein RRM-I.1 [Apopellia endiviifolia (species B)]
MAVSDNVGVENLGIGMGIGINMGIGLGHSLPVSRTYTVSLVDASDSAAELFEPSLLEQHQHHQQLSQHQFQHEQTQDGTQPGQQLTHTKSAPPPPKQLPSQITQQQPVLRENGVVSRVPEADEEGTVLDARSSVSNDSMRELEDLLTKLNPLAKEFVPPSHTDTGSTTLSASSSKGNNRRKTGYNNIGKRRVNSRTSRAQREDSIRRTVYVSDIDQQVTEEQLAALFITCGQVVDCRVCGDPNSVLRFAFVEFTDEDGARAALGLAGTMLGYYPVRVLPSKTAIVPVNPTFLPRSEDEREMCARTIYCTNIDKKVSQADVKLFFESLCGEVARLRLLGDYHHSTRIAFVEFVMAESAMAALNCSGAILGSLPIRVSPSKTPVRPRSPRPPLH